jgi:protocatechuate 3,4-dioxygenase beta subunit
VLDPDGRALAGTEVQIWQCDARGYYHHPRDRGGRADPRRTPRAPIASAPSGRSPIRGARPTSMSRCWGRISRPW